MRELIIARIRNMWWLDYIFKHEKDILVNSATYEEWLKKLSDEDLLDSFARCIIKDYQYEQGDCGG